MENTRNLDAQILAYSQHPQASGCWRVSKTTNKVHTHELTSDGWENRNSSKETTRLLRSALVQEGPRSNRCTVSSNGWMCEFVYAPGGQWSEHWFQANSIGEQVRRRPEMIPDDVASDILADFLVWLRAKG